MKCLREFPTEPSSARQLHGFMLRQRSVVEKIIASVTNPDGSRQTIEMPNGEIHEVSSKSLTEGFLVTVEDITIRQKAIASDRGRRELLDRASKRLQSRLAEPIKSISKSVAALGKTAVALDNSSETASTQAGSALESSQGVRQRDAGRGHD